MVRSSSPQTFTTCTIFAKFAKFAIFANIDSALEHPPPLHRHPPRHRSISARTVPPQNPLSLRTGRGLG